MKLVAMTLAALLTVPASLLAQKEDKDKEKSDKKKTETIVITRKDGSSDKMTIVVDGDKVTVNGKPIEEFKDGNVTINRHSGNGARTIISPKGNFSYNWNDNGMFMDHNSNTAMLGVTTSKSDEGVIISDVTKESGAAKAGLKVDDVITKVDDKKIEDPDDLTKAIRSHKPGDKVTITYLRDKKEQKATAELTKWHGFSFDKMDFGQLEMMPSIHGQNESRVFTPRLDQYYSVMGNRPRLGLSVQDTEDGKGVKVINVDEDGNAAKAGVKKDDVIVAINDKVVNTADEVAKIVRESKDKPTLNLKVSRSGKTEAIEVKMPRKLKTADL